MGNELWFMKFEIDRWRADLDEHPLEIEGAWIRICCRLWAAPQRGSLTLSTERWATILRYDETNANRVIDYLLNEKIASGKREHNGYVTLVSRRMIKEEKEREFNRLRQQTYRDNKKRNKNVTDESRPCHRDSYSYSNNYILDKELKAGKDALVDKPDPTKKPSEPETDPSKPLKELFEKVMEKYPSRNWFTWMGTHNRAHPEAVIHTFKRLLDEKTKINGDPIVYADSIIKQESQNYSARDFYAEEKERLKDESNPVRELTSKIGRPI